MRRAISTLEPSAYPFRLFCVRCGFSIDRIGEVVNLSPHDFYGSAWERIVEAYLKIRDRTPASGQCPPRAKEGPRQASMTARVEGLDRCRVSLFSGAVRSWFSCLLQLPKSSRLRKFLFFTQTFPQFPRRECRPPRGNPKRASIRNQRLAPHRKRSTPRPPMAPSGPLRFQWNRRPKTPMDILLATGRAMLSVRTVRVGPESWQRLFGSEKRQGFHEHRHNEPLAEGS
jgi:hypothetical protein